MKLMMSLILLASVSASAGVMNGGGGKGVVCRDDQHQIKSVELLDLWEARTLFGEKINFPVKNLNTSVEQVLEKLKNVYPDNSASTTPGRCVKQDCFLASLQAEAALFLKANPHVIRLRGVTLELTDDSYESAKPENCEVEQIVDYQPGERILVNQELYEKLNPLNQVALIAHESLYASLRSLANETNSLRTRRAIGSVLSGYNFTVSTPQIPADNLSCFNEGIPFAPTEVELYWQTPDAAGDGGLMVYPYLSGGSDWMGETQRVYNMTMITSDEYATLVNGKCSEDGLYIELGTKTNGPIEFDHNSSLEFTCTGGVLHAYFSDQKPGASAPTSVPLTCRHLHP